MKLFLPLLISLLIFGCASAPSTVEEAYKKTKYTVDEYSKTKIIEGPYVTISFGLDGGGGIKLRKVNNSYRLYASTFSQLGWAFFQSAYDKNAGELAFTKVNSRVGSGTTHEDFFMGINKNQLKKMEAMGIDIKIYGKNRTINISLPKVYVQGFMKRVNEIEGKTNK